VSRGTGKRFKANMIAAVSNTGTLRFRVFDERFTAPLFLDFLKRLVKDNRGRKAVLIVDGHPAHRARIVRDWTAANPTLIELHFLPGYAPELNPAEMLNQDVKTNGLGRRRPVDLACIKRGGVSVWCRAGCDSGMSRGGGVVVGFWVCSGGSPGRSGVVCGQADLGAGGRGVGWSSCGRRSGQPAGAQSAVRRVKAAASSPAQSQDAWRCRRAVRAWKASLDSSLSLGCPVSGVMVGVS